jgi:hypothetical protein
MIFCLNGTINSLVFKQTDIGYLFFVTKYKESGGKNWKKTPID